MANDNRDILELLYEELDLVEKGGYGRSVKTPWKPTSVFQDSLSCLNFGDPEKTHPCSACHLIEFVPAEARMKTVPCHHIPLNEAGETVQTLETCDNQQKMEGVVAKWLGSEIKRIEEARLINELRGH